MRRIFTVLVSIALSFISTSSFAQLLVNENFTYNTTNLVGNGSPAWTTSSSSNTQVAITTLSNNTGAVTYAGYTSGRNYITLVGASSSDDPYKGFQGNATIAVNRISTTYISFVINVTAVPTSTGSASQLMALRNGSGSLLGGFYIGNQGTGVLRFGIRKASGTNASFASTNYSLNTTYLIVIRYDLNLNGSTDDAMYMWVNPVITAQPTTASASATISSSAGSTDGSTSSSISSIQLFQSSLSGTAKIDGLRVAYSNISTSNLATNSADAWSNLAPVGAPLPVTFSRFEGRRDPEGNSLTWNVSSEENVRGYEVERSVNGQSFARVGFVPASGADVYSFMDHQPPNVAYYRIRAIDHDGKFQYTTIVCLKGGNFSMLLKAFPTVTQGLVIIQHDPADKGAKIGLFGQDGRLIRHVQLLNRSRQTSIDLSAMPAGVYFLRFEDGQGESGTIKLVRQ